MVTNHSTTITKQARYWHWFNQQINLTGETKYGIGLGLCHTNLIFKVTDVIGFTFAPCQFVKLINYSVNSIRSWLAEDGGCNLQRVVTEIV